MNDPAAPLEDLVFECLERLASHGQAAVDDLLAAHTQEVRQQVHETMALLQRIGLSEGSAPVADGVLDAPEQFGPYRLFERLGAGAMGVVYRARQLDTDPEVDLAIKLMQPGLAQVRGSRLRFAREIAALRELDHPGICPIVDDGEIDGVPFLVMPFVPGTSLRERFADRNFVGDDARRAPLLDALRQLAEALHHAHERGFVHRDVKPGNVIVRPDGRAVLLDFGLARLEDGADQTLLTASHGVVGTPAYMAPEQVAGRSDVDRRCDVYALGAMLFEGATGQLPYEATTRETLYRLILSGDLPRPSTRRDDLPRSIDVVCLTAMAREPLRRYQTAAVLAADLGRIERGESPTARLPGPLQRARAWARRHPLPTALLTILLVALVGIGSLALVVWDHAKADRARSSAREGMRRLAADPEQALREGLAAWREAPVPEALETIQAALIAERPARTWPGSGEPVEQLEFCGGDRFLIAVTADGKAQQFEVAKHDAPRAIPHDGRVGAIAVSAAGDGLVVLGDAVDGHLTAWRPGTLEKVWSAPAWREAQPVRELRFDARGDEVLCVGDRSVVVFSAEGAPRGAIACAGKPTAVTWCNADRIAIAEQRLDAPGTADSRIAVYEHDGDAWAEVAQLPDQPCVIALDTDPSEARRLLVVCAGLTERLANDQGVMEERPRAGIWDIASGWRPCGITAKGELLAGAFSSNGDRILLISRGGVVMPFRGDGSSMPNTWALDAAFAARTDPTRTCLGIMDDVGMLTLHTFDGVATRSLGRRRLRDRAQAFSIDGTLVAASNWQHELLVYRLYDPELPTIHLGENVRAALWAPGGSDVLTANTNMSGGFFGDVARWDLATGRQRAPSLGRLPHRVFEAVPSPSGQRLLCLVSYGKLQQGAMVWRVGPEGLSDKREMRVGCIDGYAMRGAMPNDNTALIADGSGAVLVWQLDSDTPARLEVPGANARGANARWVTVEADPDLSTVWVGTAGGELHRFRRGADGMHAFTGTRIFPGNIGDLKLLEDGSLMIAGGLGLVARLFPDGHVQHFDAHTWNVRSVDATFLDGERVIATGDNEGWIQLWRDDGTPLRRIPAHQGIVHTLHFSADGSRLLSASADGTARVWIVREADLLELAKRRAGG